MTVKPGTVLVVSLIAGIACGTATGKQSFDSADQNMDVCREPRGETIAVGLKPWHEAAAKAIDGWEIAAAQITLGIVAPEYVVARTVLTVGKKAIDYGLDPMIEVTKLHNNYADRDLMIIADLDRQMKYAVLYPDRMDKSEREELIKQLKSFRKDDTTTSGFLINALFSRSGLYVVAKTTLLAKLNKYAGKKLETLASCGDRFSSVWRTINRPLRGYMTGGEWKQLRQRANLGKKFMDIIAKESIEHELEDFTKGLFPSAVDRALDHTYELWRRQHEQVVTVTSKPAQFRLMVPEAVRIVPLPVAIAVQPVIPATPVVAIATVVPLPERVVISNTNGPATQIDPVMRTFAVDSELIRQTVRPSVKEAPAEQHKEEQEDNSSYEVPDRRSPQVDLSKYTSGRGFDGRSNGSLFSGW